MGILKALRRVFGGASAAAGAAADPPAPRRSKTEQIRTLQSHAMAAATERLADSAVSAPGPLQAAHVCRDDRPIDVAFALEPKHLAATVDGKVYRVALTAIESIGLNEGALGLSLHLPLPVPIDGELRAIQALSATVDDELAALRWRRLGSKYYRSAADCPYCFKAALVVQPQHGAPLPVEDGVPYASASCRACRRNFRYAYDTGQYVETASRDAL